MPLPRGLILAASAWLIVSWIISIGVQAPVEASSASFTPGVRLMLISMAVGIMAGWPLMRLSQPATPYPIRRTLLDLVALLALVQVVLWPLRLVTPWSAARAAAIDATICCWSGLAAACVASATGSARSGPRTLAMLVCLTLSLGGPVAALGVSMVRHDADLKALLRLGPLMEIQALTSSGGAPPGPADWRWIVLLAVGDAAAWASVGGLAMRRRLRNPAADPPAAVA